MFVCTDGKMNCISCFVVHDMCTLIMANDEHIILRDLDNVIIVVDESIISSFLTLMPFESTIQLFGCIILCVECAHLKFLLSFYFCI